MSETEKNYDPAKRAKFSELKTEWAKLKKESSASDSERVTAKARINAIQKELSLEVTDFNAPKPQKTNSASYSSGSPQRSNEARFTEVKAFHDTAGKLANDILDSFYANNGMSPEPKERMIAWEGLLKSFAIVWSR